MSNKRISEVELKYEEDRVDLEMQMNSIKKLLVSS